MGTKKLEKELKSTKTHTDKREKHEAKFNQRAKDHIPGINQGNYYAEGKKFKTQSISTENPLNLNQTWAQRDKQNGTITTSLSEVDEVMFPFRLNKFETDEEFEARMLLREERLKNQNKA